MTITTIIRPEAKIDWDSFFPNAGSKDFADLMIGKRLEGGVSRDVYVLKCPPEGRDSVIKFDIVAKSFQNITEWQVWNQVVGTRWEKWFAPCCSIGDCGIVLIQRKTTPLFALPKRIPSFMNDNKKCNWGEYEGRPVCHDYGQIAAISTESAKMVKAEWRDD